METTTLSRVSDTLIFMRILGIDVCKGSVVACLLTERPDEPRQFLFKAEFHNCKADVTGLKTLLDLKPDIAIMEPTGVNYSKLWGTHLVRNGCRVMLVSHNKLARHREHLDMPDKSDESDAFALACYWWDYQNQPRRFTAGLTDEQTPFSFGMETGNASLYIADEETKNKIIAKGKEAVIGYFRNQRMEIRSNTRRHSPNNTFSP
jgi:hypothetical protein